MAIKISTGLAKYLHVTGSMKKCFTGGKLKIYSGAAPATADAAATGTLLYSLVNASGLSKVKQKITFTPVTSGTTGTWTVILGGITYTFTDDGSPTPTEICNGLRALITAGMGGAFTTPAGVIGIPDNASLYVLTGTATMIVEAATAGVPFAYSSSATGAGNSITEAITTADAYGLQFEAAGDVTSGSLEKLASQTWSGIVVSDGTPGYYRLVQDDDGGGSSTSEERFQGAVSTVAGSDMTITHASVVTGETIFVDSGVFRIPVV